MVIFLLPSTVRISLIVTATARTTVSFLSAYLAVGVVFHDDRFSPVAPSSSLSSITTASLQSTMFELATKCILDSRFKCILASATACAILFYTRSSLGLLPVWRRELTLLTGHDPSTDAVVQHAILLLEQMLRESDDDKDVASIIAAADALTLTVANAAPPPVITPDHCNKENNKPSIETECSPISIVNFDGMM